MSATRKPKALSLKRKAKCDSIMPPKKKDLASEDSYSRTSGDSFSMSQKRRSEENNTSRLLLSEKSAKENPCEKGQRRYYSDVHPKHLSDMDMSSDSEKGMRPRLPKDFASSKKVCGRDDKFKMAGIGCRRDSTYSREKVDELNDYHQNNSLIREVGNGLEDLVQMVQPCQREVEFLEPPKLEIDQPFAYNSHEIDRKGSSHGETLGKKTRTHSRSSEAAVGRKESLLSNNTEERSRGRRHRTSLCPIGSCSVMSRRLKRHVLNDHLSPMFDVSFRKSMMGDVNFQRFRGHMVMVLATWFCKSNTATAEDLVAFLRRESYVPSNCHIEKSDMQWLRHVEFYIGGPRMSYYDIVRVNSPVCILHWRVMASVFHHLSLDQQIMVRQDTYNPCDPVRKDIVQRMSSVFWEKNSNHSASPKSNEKNLSSKTIENSRGKRTETRSTQGMGTKSPAKVPTEVLNLEEFPINQISATCTAISKSARKELQAGLSEPPRVLKGTCGDFVGRPLQNRTQASKESLKQHKGLINHESTDSERSKWDFPSSSRDPRVMKGIYGDLVKRPVKSKAAANMPKEQSVNHESDTSESPPAHREFHAQLLKENCTHSASHAQLLEQNLPHSEPHVQLLEQNLPHSEPHAQLLKENFTHSESHAQLLEENVTPERNSAYPEQVENNTINRNSSETTSYPVGNIGLSEALVLRPALSEAHTELPRDNLNRDIESHGQSEDVVHRENRHMKLVYGQLSIIVFPTSVAELKETARRRFKLNEEKEIELTLGRSILDDSVRVDLFEPFTKFRVILR